MSAHIDAMDQLEVINASFIAGYDLGYAHGRNDRLADTEAVAMHQAAAEVVTRLAGCPERDPDADRAAAQRRAEQFPGQGTFGGPR